MVNERITRKEINDYKREILEQTVLVSLSETAIILAVSESTVSRRAAEGRLVPYTDNSTRKGIRFLASDLRQYVRDMREQADRKI